MKALIGLAHLVFHVFLVLFFVDEKAVEFFFQKLKPLFVVRSFESWLYIYLIRDAKRFNCRLLWFWKQMLSFNHKKALILLLIPLDTKIEFLRRFLLILRLFLDHNIKSLSVIKIIKLKTSCMFQVSRKSTTEFEILVGIFLSFDKWYIGIFLSAKRIVKFAF